MQKKNSTSTVHMNRGSKRSMPKKFPDPNRVQAETTMASMKGMPTTDGRPPMESGSDSGAMKG